MRALCFIVLCFVYTSEGILVNNNGSSDYNNVDKSDRLTTQEMQHKRSAGYGGYYPDDLHNGYGYEHEPEYYPHHHHLEPHHHHHDSVLKALLLPLAGVALLGAAAVFASNPILLQLGVVSGKRRRRSAGEKGMEDILMLEKFISKIPTAEIERQDQRLLASYLSCSGMRGSCIERLSCEVQHFGATEDRYILDMVISEIINNEFIDDQFKKNIVKARKIGRSGGGCKQFMCSDLDKISKAVKIQ